MMIIIIKASVVVVVVVGIVRAKRSPGTRRGGRVIGAFNVVEN